LRGRWTAEGEYLDAVIKETLRVRPAVPVVVREVAKPFALGDYQLGPGTMVAANGFALHRREDLYPEPLRFRPERWLGQKPGTYTWIPFGGGVRHCIGRSLATYEMKYILRTVMRQFRFARSDEPDERSRRRGIGWIPREGAQVLIRERVPSVEAASVHA
jgi:cytochrome P450 family 135